MLLRTTLATALFAIAATGCAGISNHGAGQTANGSASVGGTVASTSRPRDTFGMEAASGRNAGYGPVTSQGGGSSGAAAGGGSGGAGSSGH